MTKIAVCPAASLPPGSFRSRGGVLVARLPDGTLRAVENACPHQGYPLSQGSLHDCVMTCTWHNFKFDLRTGRAIQGEEAVRLHTVEESEGQIWVDRDTSVDLQSAWASLAEAAGRAQLFRIAREAARLLKGGVSPQRILAWAGEWDCDHAEYGPGHGPALAAVLVEWLNEVPEAIDPATHRLQLLTAALTLSSESRLGLPLRPRPQPAPLNEVGPDGRGALAQRVETEDAPAAEALFRTMLQAGMSDDEVIRSFLPMLSAHFSDFGHPWIYLPLFLRLRSLGGAETADSLLGGLIFGLCNATREDLLPHWAGFRKRWTAYLGDGGPERASQGLANRESGDPQALTRELQAAPPPKAFELLVQALETLPWDRVVDALVLLGAERMLRFDLRHDADLGVEEGWLDLTHRLTVPAALRPLLPHANPAEATRLILMTGHFLALARDLEAAEVAHPPAMSLAQALRHRHPEAAAAAVTDPEAAKELQAWALSHRTSRPIFFAHDVKVLETARRESAHLQDLRPLQAAARYLASPLQERSARKAAVEAIRLVEEGKPPQSLSS